MPLIRNFGRNVSFEAERHEPRSEADVLGILRRRPRKVRGIGAGHAWSRIGVAGEVIDLRYFDGVELIRPAPDALVQVGAGCTLKRLLKALRRHRLTLPTLGAITAQTLAGATATGTHGSGSHSLSHFLVGVRLATYDPETREPAIVSVYDGPALLAARCALGSLGIVLRVVLPAVPEYRIEEHQERAASLEAVLAREDEWPLQQFALFPWSWTWLAFRRRRTELPRNLLRALFYRAWLFVQIDLGMHLILKLVLYGGSRRVRGFFRRVLPRLVGSHRRVDESRAILTLRHDLFRHVEMEVFVPRPELAAAVATIRELVELASGERADLSADLGAALARVELAGQARALHGTYTHHYPLFFRRILPDETLVSMASGQETWISISFFTYQPVDARFEQFARTVASCLATLHHARLHWGKYFPMAFADAARRYPRFGEFEDLCRRYDPAGAFWNTNL